MEQIEEIEALSDRIAQLLVGQGADVQGAVLADLLAMFLAGHIVPGDARRTYKLRRDIAKAHMKGVGLLVAVHHERIHGE